MEYYIYITTNNINGKQYIGQHKGKPDDAYLGSGLAIMRAINKYGKENFSKEIICFCATREEADEKEKYYIDLYNAVEDNHFYNAMEGGTKGDGWRACQTWMKEHPEQAKEIYQKNGERLQQWRIDNPEDFQKKVIVPLTEGAKRYWEEHPEERQKQIEKMQEGRIKWQKQNPEKYQSQIDEWRKAGSDKNSKKVRCITTGEIFPSQSEASRHYNIPQANISKCLSGERKSAGKHPKTGEKMYWEYLT